MTAPISYAQHCEDLRLAACFGPRPDGFYIDVGANNPIYDNVSFAFYQRGWRGIVVEPHPEMAALCRAVRPRDTHCEALAGAGAGQGEFYLVSEFHGFSTALAKHAQAAESEFGKAHAAIARPVVTLAELCERHAPAEIDFLSVDVEGYEAQVLRGADFKRFRPKVVLVEALAPYTLAPAWEEWEPLLLESGYRYAAFDGLNRYYVAAEAAELMAPLQGFAAPADLLLFGNFGRPLDDAAHPDADLARRLARQAMTRLPLLDSALLLELLTAGLAVADLDRAATEDDAAAAWQSVFGRQPGAAEIGAVYRTGASLRDVYARIVDADAFRAACGRISASSAW